MRENRGHPVFFCLQPLTVYMNGSNLTQCAVLGGFLTDFVSYRVQFEVTVSLIGGVGKLKATATTLIGPHNNSET